MVVSRMNPAARPPGGVRATEEHGLTSEVIFQRSGASGRITLNRPQALNALNHEMCRAIHQRLAEWAVDDTVRLVVIDGAGERAFCAGGDVRALYRLRRAGREADLIAFYRDEYRLNAFIKRYPKPYVALIDGIAMGGGVGVSVHGSHRVATERTVFAMPETGIGLFPDVGATWFLPRLPGEIGCFLGLTGHRLGTADCLYTGLADVAVHSDQLPDLIAALGGAADADAIGDILRRTAASSPAADAPPALAALRDEIDTAFAGARVEDILTRLDRAGSAFARAATATLRQKSPTSLKVALHQMREGARHTFDECMQLEYRLACRFMRGHDFFEGVRAVVIDKDNIPDWQPATLAAVTGEIVAGYFAPLPEGELAIDLPPAAG